MFCFHTIRFSRLFAEHVDNEAHLGNAVTVSKNRLRFWIVNLERMVKSIRNQCNTCRKNNKRLQKQLMAPFPVERLKPCPAWNATALDFFGPFETKGDINKRARGKAYCVLLNCMASRAVHIDISSDHNMQTLIMLLKRFVALRGYPEKLLYSDTGSQLVAESIQLKGIIKGFDQEKLAKFGVDTGLKWEFAAPDGPWQNGCSEALIKSAKKAISGAIGSQVLSFSELQTVCVEAANL